MRNDRFRQGRKAAAGGLVVLMLFGVTACESLKEVPVLSERSVRSNATLSELREWVSEEIDAVIEVTGVESEWKALGSDEVIRWIDNRDRIFEGQGLSACSFNQGKVDPAAVRVDLITTPLAQDPFPLLERVRELWVERGWEVRNRFEPDQVEAKIMELIAERDDGAMMMLGASDQEGGKMLNLMVTSPCSNDPSVAR